MSLYKILPLIAVTLLSNNAFSNLFDINNALGQINQGDLTALVNIHEADDGDSILHVFELDQKNGNYSELFYKIPKKDCNLSNLTLNENSIRKIIEKGSLFSGSRIINESFFLNFDGKETVWRESTFGIPFGMGSYMSEKFLIKNDKSLNLELLQDSLKRNLESDHLETASAEALRIDLLSKRDLNKDLEINLGNTSYNHKVTLRGPFISEVTIGLKDKVLNKGKVLFLKDSLVGKLTKKDKLEAFSMGNQKNLNPDVLYGNRPLSVIGFRYDIVEENCVVTEILPGSIASKSKLKVGDVIKAVGNQEITSAKNMSVISDMAEVKLTIIDASNERDLINFSRSTRLAMLNDLLDDTKLEEAE